MKQKGFTLLELLIVIAIIAVISAILVFVLNPAETLRKGRDSQRISDLATINRTIALYVTTNSNPVLDGGGFQGNCGTHVFIGRDSSSNITAITAAGKILFQPDGDSDSVDTDGSGWIPIDFDSIAGGSPINRLPLDPVYSVGDADDLGDEDLFYAYGCDTDVTWELNANLESTQFSNGGDEDNESTDGGNNNDIHEVGTKLTILGTSGVGGSGGPPPVYMVFVSSATSNGILGSLVGADATCQTLADAVPALAGGTWMAWLSSTGPTASSRLNHQASEIYLVDGTTKVADDWDDLTDGSLAHAIDVNEEGDIVASSMVWTGTQTNGGVNTPNCLGWSTGGALSGEGGLSSSAGSNWTRNGVTLCSSSGRLYCFSQSEI